MGHTVAAQAHDHAARAHRLAAQHYMQHNYVAALTLAETAEAQSRAADLLSRNARDLTDSPRPFPVPELECG
jgi:hypothetical protein